MAMRVGHAVRDRGFDGTLVQFRDSLAGSHGLGEGLTRKSASAYA